MSRPPRVPGYLDARPIRDGLRMSVWTVRGFRHGAQKQEAPKKERGISGSLWAGSIVLFPLLVIVMPLLIGARPGTRYYMNSTRDVAIAVTAGRTTWYVADHSTAQPGTERGRALRRALAPHLVDQLDEADAELRTVAVNEKMAQRYEEDLPGLRRTVESAWPRGLKMHRPRRSESLPSLG